MLSFRCSIQRQTAKSLTFMLLSRFPMANASRFSTFSHLRRHKYDISSASYFDHCSSLNYRKRTSGLDTSFTHSNSRSSLLRDHVHSLGPSRGPVKDRFQYPSIDLADPRRRLAVLVDGTNDNLLRGSRGIGTAVSTFAWLKEVARETNLFANVLPDILKVGVPVLLRVFGYQIPMEWEPLLLGESGERGIENGARERLLELPPSLFPSLQRESTKDSGDDSEEAKDHNVGSTKGLSIQVEFFRVERFIPVPMQIEADAQHLYNFRHHNKIEGVFYVCHKVDFTMYEALMEQQHCLIQKSLELNSMNDSSEGSSQTSPASFFNQYLIDELGMVRHINVDGRSNNGS